MFLANVTSPVAGFAVGWFLLKTLAALAVIAASAFVFLRVVAPRLKAGTGQRRMRVVERLPLDQRRALHLVEVDGETLLVGTTEGSVQILKTLGPRAAKDAAFARVEE